MPPRVYLLCGTDRPRMLARVRELARAHTVEIIDQHRISGREASAHELSGLLREPPLVGQQRLVLIEEAQRLDEPCLELVRAHAETSSPSAACLILFIETDRDDRRWQQCGPQAVVERYPLAEPSQASGFELTNAIARRDPLGALSALQQQVASGKELLELVGLVGWQLQRWLAVKRGDTAGLQPWQLERVRNEVAGRSLEGLQRSLHRLWALDVAAKQGRLPSLRTAMEGVLVELCRG